MPHRAIPAALLALACLGTTAESQRAPAADTARFAQLKFRYIGPEGNRISSVAGVPGDPRTYYAGAASGGMFKTTDGGTKWTSIFDDQPVASVGAISVAPSDPNVVWAGTGEPFIRSHISLGWRVFKSTDAGKSWSKMGLDNTGRISRIVIDRRNPELVLVAALGHAYGPQPERGAQPPAPFRVEETSIAEIHAAMRAGRLTCRALVERYLARIAAYDKAGPAINALVALNPDALRVADSLDARFTSGGPTGPLHCIPMIIKDNFETTDLPVTAGSLSLAGYVSTRDAFQVRRVREAGAIVLAKSNMAEFAFSPYETVGSILPGYTRNPYALDRVTAGSSGGTAAAVSANLGEVGLGTDTGNSIRGPSAHSALVGIRSTMGLTSRGGVVPLNFTADIAGPMARSVADAAAVFQVIVGEDPDDSVTAASRGRPRVRYTDSLRKDGLTGARIGVLRQAYNRSTADPEVIQVFRTALADLARAGAVIVDSVAVDSLDAWQARSGGCNRFKFDLNAWLARQNDRVPVKTLEAVLQSRRFHPSIELRLIRSQAADTAPAQSGSCLRFEEFRARLRGGVTALMEAQRLDALVYPTWSNPPRLIGDLNTPHGDNSQLFSPATGFPAITVPMGYTRGILPAGLQLLGRRWSEATLFRLAFAYEQSTRHRHPPAAAPPLQ